MRKAIERASKSKRQRQSFGQFIVIRQRLMMSKELACYMPRKMKNESTLVDVYVQTCASAPMTTRASEEDEER